MKTVKLCFLLLIIPAFGYAFGFGGGGGGRGIQTGTAGNYGLSMADNGNSSFTCGDSIGHLFWESGVLKFCDPGSTTKTLAGGGSSLPSQTGNSGKYLTTNGTAASWGSIAAGNGITISADIPTGEGVANLNDTTHVLTVASSTGYTQFTGTHTPWDTTPDAFAFTDETDVAADGGQSCGAAITVSGTNYATTISATGDAGYGYKINGGTFTSASGTVALNDTVAPCVNRSTSDSTATTATITIGGVSDTYSVTTTESIAYLVNQNFEGTGYDNSETWTENIGTDGVVDENDTTPTILRGNHQLKIVAGSVKSGTRTSIAANSAAYVHFLFKTPALTPVSLSKFFAFEDSAQNAQLYLAMQSNGKIRVSSGSGLAVTVGAMAANTVYHVWARYTKGTGSDAVYSVSFSESTAEPTSGDNYAAGANGTAISDVSIVHFHAYDGMTCYFDQVLTSTTAIPVGAL